MNVLGDWLSGIMQHPGHLLHLLLVHGCRGVQRRLMALDHTPQPSSLQEHTVAGQVTQKGKRNIRKNVNINLSIKHCLYTIVLYQNIMQYN